jgi:hypothetical protein
MTSPGYGIGERELMGFLAKIIGTRPRSGPSANCPGAREWRRFAKGKYRTMAARQNDLLEHLGDCDFCNRQMAKIRQQAMQKQTAVRTAKRIGVFAGIVALAIALSIWWRARRGTEQPNRVTLVDLRLLSPSRGEIQTAESQPITISHSTNSLRILLPVGAEGIYEVVILSKAGNSEVLLRSSAASIIENHQALLNVPIDLSTLKAGRYSLALRHDDSDWEYYTFTLQ